MTATPTIPPALAALVTQRGMPTMRQEGWRFTNPAPLVATGFAANARPTLTITGAPAESGQVVESEAVARLEADSLFAAANRVMADAPRHIVVTRSSVQPITITHAHDTAVAYPRILIEVAPGVRVRFVEQFSGLGSYYSMLSLVVGAGADVEYVRVHSEGNAAVHAGAIAVQVGAGARSALHQFALGGKLLRTDLHAVLNGEHTEASFNSLMLADADRVVDVHSTLEHRAPDCHSRQLYKALLTDRGRAVFRGRIHVHSQAQKTDAVQASRSLLLSDDAIINTNPELEIYADDVKCTHGATIGTLDDASLFYLRSRGIPAVEARRMLVAAFAAELLDAISDPDLRVQVEALVSARIAEVVARAQAVI